jgi:hypothetical protein
MRFLPDTFLGASIRLTGLAFIILFLSVGITICPLPGAVAISRVGAFVSVLCCGVSLWFLAKTLSTRLSTRDKALLVMLTLLDAGGAAFIIWALRITFRNQSAW